MKTLSIIISILILSGCAAFWKDVGFDPHPRKWTTEEKWYFVASVAAGFADYRSTTQVLDNGGYEMNPAYGSHPSNEKLGILFISSQSVLTVVSHYFPKLRKFLLGTKTVVNTGCAIHNSNEK